VVVLRSQPCTEGHFVHSCRLLTCCYLQVAVAEGDADLTHFIEDHLLADQVGCATDFWQDLFEQGRKCVVYHL
jgi:hypothetical protein